MGQDDWFDEQTDGPEAPSTDKKRKKPAKRRRPAPDDWDEDDDWGDFFDPQY